MPKISQIGIDTAGGLITSNVTSCQVYINGAEAVLQGARVQNHGDGSNVTMIGSSGSVFVNGFGVVRDGDLASCGHRATASSQISAA
jgi:uncharacterized Zn-binding protein involved in type VI secretion